MNQPALSLINLHAEVARYFHLQCNPPQHRDTIRVFFAASRSKTNGIGLNVKKAETSWTTNNFYHACFDDDSARALPLYNVSAWLFTKISSHTTLPSQQATSASATLLPKPSISTLQQQAL